MAATRAMAVSSCSLLPASLQRATCNASNASGHSQVTSICPPASGRKVAAHLTFASSFTGLAIGRTAIRAAQKKIGSRQVVAEAVHDGSGAASPLTMGDERQDMGALAHSHSDDVADVLENGASLPAHDIGVEASLDVAGEGEPRTSEAVSEELPGDADLSGWFKEGYEDEDAKRTEATMYARVSQRQETEGEGSGFAIFTCCF
jgi:hypothetical protein